MTPEVIAAMLARGWTWCDAGYFLSFDRTKGRPPVSGIILPWDISGRMWCASYGTKGVGYDNMAPHPTPMAAADEAEAWFRHVVAGLPGVSQPPG